MENMANLGLFAVHKIVSEYAERIYAYMEKTPRDTKLCILYLHLMRWIKDIVQLKKRGVQRVANRFVSTSYTIAGVF